MAKIQKEIDNRVKVLGVGVNSTRFDEVLEEISRICEKKAVNRPFFITTVNQEFVMLAQSDSDFARIINASDLAIPDGVGLRLAIPSLEIVPGRKLVEFLCNESKFKSKYKIFYLGARAGAARKMAETYGGEWDSGHENIQSSISNNQLNSEIIKKINKYEPDILFVAYGAPWQEKWIYANLDRLKVKVVMGVGGSFDYLVGLAKVPPDWVNKIGLEWLWRLVQEPWRWRRQLALVKFMWKLLTKELWSQ